MIDCGKWVFKGRLTILYAVAGLPVIREQREGGKRFRLSKEDIIAKLVIADFFDRERSENGYSVYVNVANIDGQLLVRFRVCNGDKCATYYFEPQLAFRLGMAFQRAAFNAVIFKNMTDLIDEAWQHLAKKGGKKVSKKKTGDKQNESESEEVVGVDEEPVTKDMVPNEIPDLAFA